jgi:hypothetical protein
MAFSNPCKLLIQKPHPERLRDHFIDVVLTGRWKLRSPVFTSGLEKKDMEKSLKH